MVSSSLKYKHELMNTHIHFKGMCISLQQTSMETTNLPFALKRKEDSYPGKSDGDLFILWFPQLLNQAKN